MFEERGVRAQRIRDRGTVSHRHEADGRLERAGDCVLVERGVPRSLVIQCPDGCGDVLTINLDRRTAKAWRFFRRRNQASLFPSVWRDTGCGSHFIIWNHTIIWCDRMERPQVIVEGESVLTQRVLTIVGRDWREYTDIAEALDEVPWDVLHVCRRLTGGKGHLVEGAKQLEGHFRRA
jgi:hypothetical protein